MDLSELFGALFTIFTCFGGALFIGAFTYFWVQTAVRNYRIRANRRAIADNCVRYWIEHP